MNQRVLLLLLAILPAVDTAAQEPAWTQSVEVVLDCPNVPDTFTVILEGAESSPITIRREAATGRWTGSSARRFDARKVTGRARLGGRRTSCVRARETRKSGSNLWVATLSFPSCPAEPVWKALQVTPAPEEVAFTYLRVLPAKEQCTAAASEEILGSVAIADVSPYKEEVYVHFGRLPPKPTPFDYHLAIAGGMFGKRKLGAGAVTLPASKVANEFLVRQNRAGDNARDLALLDKRFRNVTLKVD
jgi:hypothetical protein